MSVLSLVQEVEKTVDVGEIGSDSGEFPQMWEGQRVHMCACMHVVILLLNSCGA